MEKKSWRLWLAKVMFILYWIACRGAMKTIQYSVNTNPTCELSILEIGAP